MDGEALLVPGFCYNRVTDFSCYIWVKPSDVKQHHADYDFDRVTPPQAGLDDGYFTDDDFQLPDMSLDYTGRLLSNLRILLTFLVNLSSVVSNTPFNS